MTTSGEQWVGWLGHDADSVNGKMVWGSYEPKAWEETDVDIAVTHSSVCGTDVHVLRNDFGSTEYPVCVGHELVGKVIRLGSQASSHLQLGDTVGVGGISDACLNRFGPCSACTAGEEQFCPQMKQTYAGRHFNGSKTMGGHAKFHRCPSHFVYKVPEGLKAEYAAPLLCSGISMYAPLKRHGCGPGKTVGIIGVGGLGHFGIVIAKAMGAERVVGISRSESKRDEVLSMGANDYIATGGNSDWKAQENDKFDLLITTVGAQDALMSDYLWLLKRDGIFVQVGNPGAAGLSFSAWPLFMRRVTVTGSILGTPAEMREMFDLAAEKKLEFMVETRKMEDANQTMLDMEAGKARYRYVLVNE
ncbi:zinc-binding dehydrogenase domain-containing protein [Sarocladium implicatum]|nr:zinc-binding dehydrogenase domain-containing protein [Sarocladium implicatum]